MSSTSQRERFRLLDETGLSVAEFDGPMPSIMSEVFRYYIQYKQDGPHKIQQLIGRKWKDWTVNFEVKT